MTHAEVVDAWSPSLRWNSLTIVPATGSAYVGDLAVDLSPNEFSVLHILLTRRNTAMSKDAIQTALQTADTWPDLRMIDVFVQRLRRKLLASGLPNAIASIPGRGYAIVDRDDEAEPSLPLASPPVASPPVASPPLASPPLASPPLASNTSVLRLQAA